MVAAVNDTPDTTTFETSLRGRRAVLDDRLTSVRRELEELEARRSELAEQIGHIDALLMERPAERLADPADSAGARSQIADMVVAVLTELDRPLHYREIEKELRARGVEAGGQDPANTLLARFFNDPRLYRPKRGTYALRNGQRLRSVGSRHARSRKGR